MTIREFFNTDHSRLYGLFIHLVIFLAKIGIGLIIVKLIVTVPYLIGGPLGGWM